MISQNISSNPRPASCGASSLLSAYEKSHHETVMAKFNFTANFAERRLRPFSFISSFEGSPKS